MPEKKGMPEMGKTGMMPKKGGMSMGNKMTMSRDSMVKQGMKKPMESSRPSSMPMKDSGMVKPVPSHIGKDK